MKLLAVGVIGVLAGMMGLLMDSSRKPLPASLRNRQGLDAPNRVVVFGDEGPMTTAMIEELRQSPAVTDLLVVYLVYDAHAPLPEDSPDRIHVSYPTLAKSCADKEVSDQSRLIAECRAANGELLDRLDGRHAAFFVHTTGSLSILARAASFRRASVFGPERGVNLDYWRAKPHTQAALWNAFTLHHRTEPLPRMVAALWDAAKNFLKGLPIDDQVDLSHVSRAMWVETAWVPLSKCDEYANDDMLAISELLPREATHSMEHTSAMK